MKTKKRSDESSMEYSEELQTDYPAGPEIIDDPHLLVERRAYELWLQRGGGDGDAVHDWLQAETEIYAVLGQPVSGMSPAGSEPWQRATHGR